jgi:hypothetical protein
MNDWSSIEQELNKINNMGRSNTMYAEKYHKLVRDAYMVAAGSVEGHKPTESLMEVIVSSELSRNPFKAIGSVDELREIVERNLFNLLPQMFKKPVSKGFVVITIPETEPSNKRPFRLALESVSPKQGVDRSQAVLYAFSATVESVEYLKVGYTTLRGTYASKNRYAPMIDYTGQAQILQWGRVHEVLIAAFFGKSYKETEWFTEWRDKYQQLIDALSSNEKFTMVKPLTMTNISEYALAFSGAKGASLDDHLSLYRLSYRGKTYRLTQKNLQSPLSFFLAPNVSSESSATQAAERATVAVVGDAGTENESDSS